MKAFLIHLGVQIGTAAAAGIVTTLAGADYSSLGAWGGAAQAAAAIAAAAYNNFGKPKA